LIIQTNPTPKRIAPITTPIEVSGLEPDFSIASKAGIINEKKEAVNITPAAKAKKQSSNLFESLFIKKTGIAPKDVASPAHKLASKPAKIRFSGRYSIIFFRLNRYN
jgi:hypothetical protein